MIRITASRLAIVGFGLVLSTLSVQGQDRARYRDFQLGAGLPSVSALTGMAASEAKTIHQRPAVMQDLQWRPPYFTRGSAAPQNDSVRQIVFSFYNDQLFRLVIDYDQQRTDGMTDLDMIDAISEVYGSARPRVEKAPAVLSQIETESGAPVARWGDAEYSVVLYRSSYGSGFRVILADPRLAALARTADREAARLDEREAPQREIARQKKEAEDTRVSKEKARVSNKAAFRL